MLDKLQRKFGRYAIPNLTIILLGTYVVGYVLQVIGLTPYLALDPAAVLRGQIWRLVTWILMPPPISNLITALLMLFVFYQFGQILENTWGDFRYNFFVFSGMIITIIGAFVAYAIKSVVGWTMISYFSTYLYSYNTYYISMSILLAVAAMYPDMTVRLYFIIPIRFKWVAIIDIVFMLYECWQAYSYGIITNVVMIICSLINLVWFLILMKRFTPVGSAKQKARKTQFRRSYREGERQSHAGGGAITKHRCAVCGRTERDGADLEFRFCSKCNGNYEYCQDHLFTHKHIM